MTALLVIDTASEELGVAFVPADGEPLVRTVAGGTNHSRLLIAMVDTVLQEAGTKPDGIAVITGPGSYAGIRVGIATAGGLALGWGLPLSGIPTLRAAAAAAGLSGRFAAIHPAGRGEYAVQLFEGVNPVGPLYPARREELPRLPLAGEGARELGGSDVGVAQRLAAAAQLVRDGLAGRAEAVYLREPHVTLSRARWRRERAAETYPKEEHR